MKIKMDNECMNEWMNEMKEWMNEWKNEWMKYLMDLLHNLILVEISFWKEQESHNNIYYLYKVHAYDNSRYYNSLWMNSTIQQLFNIL